MIDSLLDIQKKVADFEIEAHNILAKEERSKSRVISVEVSKRELAGLSIKQECLLNDALFCIENGLYRPAHVMAWAAFIDYLLKKMCNEDLKKIHSVRPGWSKLNTIEELQDNILEYQLIDAGKEMELLTKHEVGVLKGDLIKRNKCAHPSDYNPNLNESLGYVSEIIRFIKKIENK